MAATGTPTPNIGLRRPQGTDPASVDDINYNSNLIDTKLGAVGNTSVQEQINSLNSKLTIDNSVYTITDSTHGYIPTTISPNTHLIISAYTNANDKAVRYFKKGDYFNLQVYDADDGTVLTSGDIRIVLGIMKR